ncbi:MAG: hypothetical protein OEW75_14440, partial [Cyclobacteriaceae bacterium]|nr:hypothetical protein [Cyclobacteriaceae bacterium]
MAQFIKNRVVRIILRVLVGILFVPILALILVQFPQIQTKLTNYVIEKVNSNWEYKLSLEKISVSWFDEAEFQNLLLQDPEGNNLLSVDEVKMDFNIYSLLFGENIEQDVIILNQPEFLLTQIQLEDSTYSLNINHFLRTLQKGKQKGKTKNIYINQIYVKEGSFTYRNQIAKPISSGFDPNYFNFEKTSFQLDLVSIIGPDVKMHISELSTTEPNIGLEISPLNGDFHLSTHSLALTKMDIRAGNTLISDSIVFTFNNFYDFNYIWDSVYIDANLKNTVVDKKDLIKFFPNATRLPDKATISGKFSGLLSDFDFNNFNITFGENTRLSGTMTINGLPSLQETFLSIDLINSTITLEDIESITKLKKGYYPELGVMRMDGQYLGYLNDFVAFGNFNTKYGTINSDINLKLSDDQEAKYSGQLALKNFNVGILTGIKDLGKVNFKGSVEGSGFSAKTTSMHVNGNIKSLEYKGYTYKNIYSDGDLANQFFEGVLNVDDENLKFDMTGKIDMSEDREYLNFTAHLDTINLKNLGLYEKNLAISTFGTVEINGLDPDYMEGTASFSNLFLKTDNNQLSLDTVHLIALKNEKIRTIEIKSELAEAKLTGEYKLSTIFNELSSLYKDYLNIFRNDTTKINSLAELKKDTTSVPNVFDYQINFTDINSLFDVFVPDLKVSKNTSFIGNYQGGQTQIFNISTTSDTITYKNNTFLNNNLEINSSKALDNKVLAMIFIKSEEQNLAGIYSENLLSEAIWENDHIDFELNLDQESYKNHFNVLADIDFKNDSTLVTFQNSEIKLLDKLWELSEDGKIIFS